MLRVKLLVCPHHGDEIICVGKIDYIVRIARKHMHRLYLLSAYLKAKHLVCADLSFFDESMTGNYNKEFPL